MRLDHTSLEHLPEKFHIGHDYCLIVHATLLNTLVNLEGAGLVQNVTINFKSDIEKASFQDSVKNGKDIIDWMEEHNYSEEVKMLFFKRVFIALLSDTLHFFHEALRCSAKGKTAVSFSLLRKPLMENLFYLEWFGLAPIL